MRNKRSLQRIFGDQTRPKFLAVVPKARATGAVSDDVKLSTFAVLVVVTHMPMDCRAPRGARSLGSCTYACLSMAGAS